MSIMQKILIVLFFLPFFGWGQISVGNNQTICEGDIVNVQASTSVQSSTVSSMVGVRTCCVASIDSILIPINLDIGCRYGCLLVFNFSIPIEKDFFLINA